MPSQMVFSARTTSSWGGLCNEPQYLGPVSQNLQGQAQETAISKSLQETLISVKLCSVSCKGPSSTNSQGPLHP